MVVLAIPIRVRLMDVVAVAAVLRRQENQLHQLEGVTGVMVLLRPYQARQ